MSMFEKMLGDMIGISPQEMTEMIAGMQTLLRDGVETLNKIERDTAAIRRHLNIPESEVENVNGKSGGSD